MSNSNVTFIDRGGVIDTLEAALEQARLGEIDSCCVMIRRRDGVVTSLVSASSGHMTAGLLVDMIGQVLGYRWGGEREQY